MADTRRFTAWSLGLLAVLLGLVTIWDMQRPFAATRSTDLQTQVKELADRVQELEAKLACLSKDGYNVVFDKCNVYIRNGSWQTDGVANGNYTSVSGGKRRDAMEQDSWRAGNLLERN